MNNDHMSILIFEGFNAVLVPGLYLHLFIIYKLDTFRPPSFLLKSFCSCCSS